MADANDDKGPDYEGGKHDPARALAEKALRAEAAGDADEADRLFAEAEKTDPEAAADVLQDDMAIADATTADTRPASDEELAAMTTTVRPRSDAPSRAGITGPGSGADSM